MARVKQLQLAQDHLGASSALDFMSQLQLGGQNGIELALSKLNFTDAPGLDRLISELETLIPQSLSGAHAIDQTSINDVCDVSICEMDLTNASLPDRLKEVTDLKDEHCACRNYALGKCEMNKLIDDSNPTYGINKFLQCGGSDEITVDNAADIMQAGLAWYRRKKLDYNSVKAECDATEKQLTDVVEPCDKKQQDLESGYCQYHSINYVTCTAYEDCRTQKYASCTSRTTEVQDKEKARKEIYKQYVVVKCILVDVISFYNNPPPTGPGEIPLSDVADKCKTQSEDDSHLDVNYAEQPPVSECAYDDILTQNEEWAETWLKCSGPAVAGISMECGHLR